MARVIFELDNWVSRAGLGCGNERYRDLAKTYYLTGTVITLLIVLMMTDYIGRKKGFYGVFITSCLGMIVAISVPNFLVRNAALGVAMASQPLFFSLYTIYFSETLRKIV